MKGIPSELRAENYQAPGDGIIFQELGGTDNWGELMLCPTTLLVIKLLYGKKLDSQRHGI